MEQATVKQSKEDLFPLKSTPQYHQLAIHMHNLIKLFRAEQQFKNEENKDTDTVVDVLRFLCESEMLCEQYIHLSHYFPVEFRCSGLIQYYGKETILAYLNLIYGESVVTNE